MKHSPIPGHAIHYSIAEAPSIELLRDERTRHVQAVALNEFRNSYCDHYGLRDLVHYSNATGKDLRWLLHHARFSDPISMVGAMMDTAIAQRDVEMMEMILLNQ